MKMTKQSTHVSDKFARLNVPDKFARLKRIWDLVLANSGPVQATLAQCQLCEKMHGGPGPADNFILTCGLCQHTFHESCCRLKLLPHLNAFNKQLCSKTLRPELQQDAVLCVVCQQLARQTRPP